MTFVLLSGGHASSVISLYSIKTWDNTHLTMYTRSWNRSSYPFPKAETFVETVDKDILSGAPEPRDEYSIFAHTKEMRDFALHA